MSHWSRAVLGCALLGLAGSARGQLPDGARAAVLMASRYEVLPNLVYRVASGRELKLDVYRPREATGPVPVVLFIHGGGWVAGNKEAAALLLLPYLAMGWAAVNVEYRLAEVAPAPAAMEDCRCALHWIGRNAKAYAFDTSKVVITGGSAGGHLALATAMVPPAAGYDNACAAEDDPSWTGPWADPAPKVVAVVNWFGITDVAAMLQGPQIRSYAVSWLGAQSDREGLAKQVSPISWVRAGLPAVLTIHGDADPVVPYAQATRLHEALTKAGVRNQLLTVSGGKHGRFSAEQNLVAYETIQRFLASLGLDAVR
ncbi:MAG TPA: alpha/beta hydrolase [Anaeromyxobacteraceae bacterium]|nr:alpha/beta hydrolase [Anaeromyxobacteraceae bacterium]